MQFATATGRVVPLSDAKCQGNLEPELRRLSFIPPIVVDLCRDRDYAEPANLMFSLVSSRYERPSMIVTGKSR